MTTTPISRRQWIACSAAATVGLGLSSLFADESAAELDIIDCHTHFYDPGRPEGIPWPPKDSPLYRTCHSLRSESVVPGNSDLSPVTAGVAAKGANRRPETSGRPRSGAGREWRPRHTSDNCEAGCAAAVSADRPESHRQRPRDGR